MLSRHVATHLVSPGQADVLVDGEDDEAVQVAGPDGVVSQARPRQLKRLEIQSGVTINQLYKRPSWFICCPPDLTNILVLNPDGVGGELWPGPIERPLRVTEVRDLLAARPSVLLSCCAPD